VCPPFGVAAAVVAGGAPQLMPVSLDGDASFKERAMPVPPWIAHLVSDVVISAGAQAILSGLASLREYFGKLRFDGVYTGAEDFWYRGVETEKISDGAKIRVTGLLSPFGPYMPSNPRAKPGYTASGWTRFSEELERFLREKRLKSPDDPLSASGYDVLDVLVWGDLVIRPRSSLRRRKVYAGLYNQYGKSFECVPVFIDEGSKNQRAALDTLGWPRNPGAIVTLTGTVRRMASYYAAIGLAKPMELPGMPCYCIEVSAIRLCEDRKSVLYMTSWSSFHGDLVTEFFDVMSPDERHAGLDRLRSRGPRDVYMYFDSYDHPFKRQPKGNEKLEGLLGEGD
jgi:hypothetical protein